MYCKQIPRLKLLLFILLLFCSLFLFPKPVSAQVIINEVMPAPSSGDEWIELKNVTSQVVTLSGWAIEDNTGALTSIPSFATASIQPFSFAVFEVKNRLNNSGDQVLLRKPDLSQADFFQYNSSSTDLSWSRISDSAATFVQTESSRGATNIIPSPSPSASPSASSSPSPVLTPTPAASPTPAPLPGLSPLPTTSSPVPTPTPLASLPLQLSEAVACPETNQPEWVEFFNPNTIPVSISNWKLKDNSTNTRVITLNLPAQSFATFDLGTGIFNNDGDSLFVLDADGDALIELELLACTKGQSVVFVNGNWQLTSTVTKNSTNIFSSSDPDSSPYLTPLQLQAFGTTSYSSSASSYMNLSFETPSLTSSELTSVEPLSSESETAASESTEVAKTISSSSPTTESKGDSLTDLPQNAEEDEPFFYNKYFLMTLFAASIVAIGAGGFGVYQWYTERRAEEVLEIL